ncbi:RNA-directed DNA polymerase [Laspinema olomoucense]|uniref:RNA-directed DNA polymerase n=1 Tax=Laspinema olomoucense D3b TaxID=2953688 RepID=A0ABT2NEC6_9CYAN|nr:RNA-directed DNA polymerase [Laspinema sp. D3b]MCT7981056.1 RNA-directed DNA polymerase [Laspinema sp. D3b]
MKRFGNLWPQISSFANLLIAARKAQKGKRFRPTVLEFNDNLESNLIQLQTELNSQTYQPGNYHQFYVYEPKKRLISAAPYRDRVVHHALCNIIAPLLERSFIDTSYANRIGYGSHCALEKFTTLARTHRYILQCDIRKFFPTINHSLLKAIIRRKIKCKNTLWLLDTIIDNGKNLDPVLHYFPGDDLLAPVLYPCGLPVGNLTSQFLANLYLNGFDHFILQALKIPAYVRYVDDFALFANDHTLLAQARPEIETYLATLRLKIHPIKSQLFETRHGANFLGFRILPQQIRVRSDSLQRLRGKLKTRYHEYQHQQIDQSQFQQSIQSWQAHLDHGNTAHLQHQLFDPMLVEF